MKFTRLHSIIIITLVLLSLAGLSFIQLNWLQGAKVIREEKILERLNKVTESIQATLDRELASKKYLPARCDTDRQIKAEALIRDTEHLIDSILRAENLNMPFEYGLSSCKSNDFSWFSDPGMESQLREGCQMKLDNCSFYNHNNNDDHLHLYTIFPQKDKLIFREMSLAIGSSILFMLLLIGAFAYALYTIFRQKRLSEMKNDFINNLTHEFKTPIASIALAAKTLKRLGPVNESGKAMSYLNLIDQEGKRLENHVDKVLQMATMDSGNFALDKQKVDVHEMIHKVRDSFSVILEKKKGEMLLDLQAREPVIDADPMHLFNMIYNVVDNAIKYNKEKPVIRLSTHDLGDELEIGIRDNGIGMSKETQQQIFERFYRQKTGNVHDVKGFGLGLAYVKRMMEAHGGEVELESQPGKGSRFYLVFRKK